MSNNLLSLAARNVVRNRRRTLVTLAAITFGVAAAVTFQGVRNAFMDWMLQDVVKGQTGAFQIHRKGYLDDLEVFPNQLNMPEAPAFRERLERIPGVAGVTGRITFGGQISNGRSQTMFIARGIDPVTEPKVCPRVGFDIVEGGTGLAAGDRTAMLVGEDLAKSLSAVPAPERERAPEALRAQLVDRLTLQATSPQGRSNAIDGVVKGLMESPAAFENKRVVTVPLVLAQELIGLQGKVTEYAVAVKDIDELETVMERVRAELGPDYEVTPWWELRPFFRDLMNRQAFLLGIVTLILFVIVLTGVVNTMLMTVFERVREIGTMLALGVRRAQILRLFLLEAAIIGLLGGLVGSLLGAAWVDFIGDRGVTFTFPVSGQPVTLRPFIVWTYPFKVTAVALAGVVLAGLLPAWRGSRMDPVVALRAN